MNKRIWDKFLTGRDKTVSTAGGFGARAGFGKRPALLDRCQLGIQRRAARTHLGIDQFGPCEHAVKSLMWSC
jgi:hypothetical protein